MNTCDRCGPGTYAPKIITLANGGILTFCLHCTNRFRTKLEIEGALIYPLDEDD